MNARLIPSILIAGPTASGKTDIAIELAVRVGGEIISVDSMQVYRGLDIGTAKPTADQRRRVRHHLIDIADITESFDAARYLECAFEAIEIVRARGRLPILCGGTGLYFKGLIHGVGHAPPPDPVLRAELESTPLPELLEELATRDPKTFENIDRHNRRRVMRALEVVILTGKPFSDQRAPWPTGRPLPPMPPEAPLFGIKREPDDLKARINARTEQMFANGLVEETRRLL
ncbi:MAG: tRNA (adenosine(37)-N6)-dimethylallyltransferase MiaA, partial [Verrucomicrobiota bacterium]|nr:tRNA (adenosine(37)-N6)-dimethylallyltransferase MiaA [Verrucomicrobiota bacterium]